LAIAAFGVSPAGDLVALVVNPDPQNKRNPAYKVYIRQGSSGTPLPMPTAGTEQMITPTFRPYIPGAPKLASVIPASDGINKLQNNELPNAPTHNAGEVRVALRAATPNHLDLWVIDGVPGAADRFPNIVGADGAGVVESTGADVSTVRQGERVMINPGISDYSCEFCQAGEHSLCVNYRLLGEHLPGTVAELVTVPAQNVARLPVLAPVVSCAEEIGREHV